MEEARRNAGYVRDFLHSGRLIALVSLEAIMLSIFVLISQNRQAGRDRIKTDLDYQVNLKAELEIALILKQLTELQQRMEMLQQDQVHVRSSLAHLK